MKKLHFKIFLVLILSVILNLQVVKADKTTLENNEIGTIKDGKVIFYTLLYGTPDQLNMSNFRAEPFAMGYNAYYNPDSVPQNDLTTGKYSTSRKFYYGSNYPETKLYIDDTTDFEPANLYTISGGGSSNFSYTESGYSISTDKQTANYRLDNPASLTDVEVNVNYQIVTGLTGEKDLLRYDYSVKNTSSITKYIALQTNTDTYLMPGSIATDRPVFAVDNAGKWIYDSANNNLGFIQSGGQVTKTIRFVQRDDNTDNHLGINGMPNYVQNLFTLSESNPMTAYYGFKPDIQTNSTHIYNMPNVVDLCHYMNREWVTDENQKSGYITGYSYATPTDYNGSGDAINIDSGINIQWNKTAVAPGQTIHFVYFVGNGKHDVSELDGVKAAISAQNSGIFTRTNNIVSPLDVNITVFNSDTVNRVETVNVKLAFDPLQIKILDQNNNVVPYDTLSTTNTTINGITGDYPYIYADLPSLEPIGSAGNSQIATFKVVGINNTTSDLNAYVKGIVTFTKTNQPIAKSFQTVDYTLTVPAQQTVGVSLDVKYLKFSDNTDVLPSNNIYAQVEAGKPYKLYAEHVDGYTLKNIAKIDGVEVSIKPSDPYITFTDLAIPREIQFLYEPIGTVKVNHWLLAGTAPDIANDTLLLNEIISGVDGTIPANVISIGEFSNYNLVYKTGDSLAYTIDGTNEINFYYTQNDTGIGHVLVRHVENGTDILINNEFLAGTYGNTVTVKPMTDGFLGYRLSDGQNEVVATLGKDLQVFTYEYTRLDDYKGSVFDTKSDTAIVMVAHKDKDKTTNDLFAQTRYVVPLFGQTGKTFDLRDTVIDFIDLGYVLSNNPDLDTPITLTINNAIKANIFYEKQQVSGDITFWLGGVEVTDPLELQTYSGRALDTIDLTTVLVPVDQSSLLDPKPRYVLSENLDSSDGVYVYPINNEPLKVYVMVDPTLVANLDIEFVDVWGDVIETKNYPNYNIGTQVFVNDSDFNVDYNIVNERCRSVLFTNDGGGTLNKKIEVYPAKVNAHISYIDIYGNILTNIKIGEDTVPLVDYTLSDLPWGSVITDQTVLEKVEEDINGFKTIYEIKYVNGIHTITLDRNGPFDKSIDAFKILATITRKDGENVEIVDPKPMPKPTPNQNDSKTFDQKYSGKESNGNTNNNYDANYYKEKDKLLEDRKAETNIIKQTKILLQDMTRETKLKVMLDSQNKLISLKNVEYKMPFLFGYLDNTAKPDYPITRAELAEVIYRLYYNPIELLGQQLNFNDVSKEAWYEHSINFVNKYGVMIGYGDGTFRPEQNLTRAEFVTVIVNLTKLDLTPNILYFTDISGNWAEQNILTAYKNKIVFGYEDGTFKPNNKINRAEVVSILNKILNRGDFYSKTNQFTDVLNNKWYYDDIMNSANEIINE